MTTACPPAPLPPAPPCDAAPPSGRARGVRRQRVRRALLLSFLLLFPLTFDYYSPVLPVLGALRGVATFSLLFWTAWTLASLVLGRAACGWICPLAALQELWRAALERPARHVRALAPLRYVLFAAWIGSLAWALVRGGGLRRLDLLFLNEHAVSWDDAGGAVIYAGMFGLVLLAALPLGGRAFCRHLCWWAPLGILGARAGAAVGLPVPRVARSVDRCTGCGRCERACAAGLDVRALAAGSAPATDCVACASCVDACAAGALRLAWDGARGGCPSP